MIKLGTIKRDFEIGYAKAYQKYMWVACTDCGKERWVRVLHGKPEEHRCWSCANSGENNPMFGKRAPNWKGGEILWKDYIFVYKPEHPRSNGQGYIKRATLVLEEKLGRYLKEGYLAHHENEIKTDDRPENLEEKEHGEHTALHNIKRRK